LYHTQSYVLVCDAFINCNPVWTRQGFGLLINIHEIVLKVKVSQAIEHQAIEHQAIDHQAIEHQKAKPQKIVKNKKYFIKHVKLYN